MEDASPKGMYMQNTSDIMSERNNMQSLDMNGLCDMAVEVLRWEMEL